MTKRKRNDENDRFVRRVRGLKIKLAGKSIPLEKYAIKQCERFEIQRWLFVPVLVTSDLYNFHAEESN